jgi:hypothetical protein
MISIGLPSRKCCASSLVVFEIDTPRLLIGTPSFISKKNVCITYLCHQSGVSGIVPNVVSQPLLVPKKAAQRDSHLQLMFALVSRRKRTSVAQYIAPYFRKFAYAVERLDEQFMAR